jgi:hypothetical protein
MKILKFNKKLLTFYNKKEMKEKNIEILDNKMHLLYNQLCKFTYFS